MSEIGEEESRQEVLEKSEERLRIALEGNSEGVWDWDVRKGPAVFSEGYARMLGYEPEEFAKDYDSWRALVHPDDIGRVDRAHAEHIYEGKRFRVELRMKKKNGDWCWILSRGAVVERDAEGHALRMVGTHMDITDQKLAEAEKARLQEQLLQAQKLESVGRLAGGIAHDFNNLLTVINGYSDLLLRELAQEDPHREIMAEIRTVGQRAASLTRQLLAFSRKQILHPQPLIVDPTISDMHHLFSRLLGEDIQLQMSLNAGDAAIFADPGQFDQVLMNLVVNARDAMPRGGVLTLETKAMDTGGPERAKGTHPLILVEVRDTGVGMDEATKSHLFEPYFTTKETGKGTGLGLSTVQGIIVQSGGQIEVESAPGAGTSFRIYLPKMEGPVSALHSMDESENLFGSETILVVEDEFHVRTYTVAALKAYGYRVLTAENGESALRLIEKEHGIDLVLTDLVMPKMGGRELAAALSRLQPSLKIVYVSGYSSDLVEHQEILENDLTLIEKPFSPEQLARKLRRVLGPSTLKGKLLILADGDLQSLLRQLLSRAGYEATRTSRAQFLETGPNSPVDIIIADVPEAEHEAIEAVRALRMKMPDACLIVILDAKGGRFLEMERLLGADGAIIKPISAEFLLKTVREVLARRILPKPGFRS